MCGLDNDEASIALTRRHANAAEAGFAEVNVLPIAHEEFRFYEIKA